MPFRPGESGNKAGRPKGARNKTSLPGVVDKLIERGIHPVDAICDLIPELEPAQQLTAYRVLLEYSCPKPTVYLGNDPDDPLLPAPRDEIPTEELLARVEARKNGFAHN